MTRFTCAICLVLASLASAQEKARSEIIDLRGLAAALAEDGEFALQLPLHSALEEQVDIVAEGSSGGPGDVLDGVIEVVRALKMIDDGADEAIWTAGDGMVQVTSSPERVARVRRFLEGIEQRLMRSATVEILELDPDGLDALPSSRLTGAEAATFLQSHPPRSRSVRQLRLGRRETLRASKLSQVLADYNVEVAQKSKIADPRIISFFEGQDASVWVAARPDGRFRVDFALCAADRIGNFRLVQQVSRDMGALELPRCSSRLIRNSADLAEGGAFVFGTTDTYGRLFMVRLTKVDPEPQTEAGLAILATDHLTRALGRSPIPLIPQAGIGSREVEDPFNGGDDQDLEPRSVLEQDQVMEIVTSRAIYPDEGESEGQSIEIAHELWVIADDATRANAREIVAQICAPLDRTIDCEMRWDLLDSEEFARLDQTDVAAIASRLGSRVLLSTRLGMPALAVSGKEMAYITDKEVEIASDSQIMNPKVGGCFSGIAFRFTPTTSGSDAIVVNSEIVIQTTSNETKEFQTNMPEIGPMDQVSGTRIAAHPRLRVKPGVWSLLCATQVPGGLGYTAVATIRLR